MRTSPWLLATSFLSSTLITLSAQAADPQQAASTVLQAAKQAAQDAQGGSLPEWMQRTDVSVDTQSSGAKPNWAIETIQPLSMQAQDTIFWQGRLSHRDRDETLNLGLGYRHLLQDKSWMFGLNAFLDGTRKYDHRRLGIGLEAFSPYATYRLNHYNATSGEKTVSDISGIRTTEQALDGWDYSIELPVPYVPWARLTATGFSWDGVTTRDVDGYSLGLRANPTGNLEFEVGVTDDNRGSADTYLTLTWHLDRPAHVKHTARDGISPQAFTARNLEDLRLEKVRRNNTVIVERKRTGSGGIVVGRGN